MNEFLSLATDDRLVETWDALVAGQDSSTLNADPRTLDSLLLLHRAFEQDNVDHAFLDRLQSELQHIAVTIPPDPEVAPRSEAHFGPRPLVHSLQSRLTKPPRPRNLFSFLGIAAVIAVISAGLFVTWVANQQGTRQSGPFPSTNDSIQELRAAFAPPIPEVLLDIVVNPAAFTGTTIDTTWNAELGHMTILPGAELATNHAHFSCCTSALIIQIQHSSGQFTAGESALIYRSGSSLAESTSPATTYDLGPGDTALVSSTSHAVLANNSRDDMIVLVSRVQISEEQDFGVLPPAGVQMKRYINCRNLNGAATDSINIQFKKVTMNPGALFTVESRAKECLVGWYSDLPSQQVRFLPGDTSAFLDGEMGHFLGTPFTIHAFSEGSYTILNPASQPITLYLMHTSET